MKKTLKKNFHSLELSPGKYVVKTSFDNPNAPAITLLEARSKSQADRIALRLNQVIREETFKPKSAGRRSRSKGHSFERDTAIALRALYPNARRHLEYHAQDANGIDLIETGSFKIQCKKLKAYAPLSRIEEVKADRSFGDIPLLITAGDSKEPIAALYLDDFLNLIKAARRLKLC